MSAALPSSPSRTPQLGYTFSRYPTEPRSQIHPQMMINAGRSSPPPLHPSHKLSRRKDHRSDAGGIRPGDVSGIRSAPQTASVHNQPTVLTDARTSPSIHHDNKTKRRRSSQQEKIQSLDKSHLCAAAHDEEESGKHPPGKFRGRA